MQCFAVFHLELKALESTTLGFQSRKQSNGWLHHEPWDSRAKAFQKHPTSKSAWTTSKAPALAALASSGFFHSFVMRNFYIHNCGRFIDGKFIKSAVFTLVRGCVSFCRNLLELGIWGCRILSPQQKLDSNLKVLKAQQEMRQSQQKKKTRKGEGNHQRAAGSKSLSPQWLEDCNIIDQKKRIKSANPWSIWYPKLQPSFQDVLPTYVKMQEIPWLTIGTRMSWSKSQPLHQTVDGGSRVAKHCSFYDDFFSEFHTSQGDANIFNMNTMTRTLSLQPCTWMWPSLPRCQRQELSSWVIRYPWSGLHSPWYRDIVLYTLFLYSIYPKLKIPKLKLHLSHKNLPSSKPRRPRQPSYPVA